jgi:ribosomal protein L37AE/L43A
MSKETVKLCPTCGREMRPVTSRTKEGAWRCDYCQSDKV